MAHFHRFEDDRGDLVEVYVFCSDFCHRCWCDMMGVPYGGWDGCHELEFDDLCVGCEDVVPGVNRSNEGDEVWV